MKTNAFGGYGGTSLRILHKKGRRPNGGPALLKSEKINFPLILWKLTVNIGGEYFMRERERERESKNHAKCGENRENK
ncbi:MAG: hypothetical protein LBF78_10495 [Treponema sp.]|jgi:hypothetical protein|nr:hypothetical protein [Treponema sp.]